jgi:hypothetical protein
MPSKVSFERPIQIKDKIATEEFGKRCPGVVSLRSKTGERATPDVCRRRLSRQYAVLQCSPGCMTSQTETKLLPKILFANNRLAKGEERAAER